MRRATPPTPPTPFTPPSPRALRPTVLAAALALVCAAPAVLAQTATATASAAAEARSFDIPAQPLGATLARIATEGGQTISIDAAQVKGLSAPAVQGRYTALQAAQAALVGSGLQLLQSAGGLWTLHTSQATAPLSASAVAPAASTGRGNSQTMSEVRVTAQAETSPTTEQTGSYTTRALTIGKIQQSIRETPQSVTVVTRQQMDDQNLTTVDQVLAQTTGTTASQRNFGAHTFVIRGYALTDANYLVDGVQATVSSPTGWMPLDTAIYDRVEVLRGAAGMVVGASDPSGAVNLVRKRPRAEAHFDVVASAGSWNNYRTELDAGGPINAQGTVRARAVATFQDNDFFYDVAHKRQPLFYGIIDADLGQATKATLGVRHQQTKTTGYAPFGLPRYSDGGSIDLPRSTSLAQNWGVLDAEMNEVFGEVEHRLNDHWKAKVTLSHAERDMDQNAAIPRGAINRTTLAGSNYLRYYKRAETTSNGVDANLSGTFDAFGLKHQLMAGASASRLTERSSIVQINGVGAVNVFNPNPWLIPAIARPAFTYTQDSTDEQTSVYASTRLQLAPPLHLLLGGRITSIKYRSDSVLTNTAVSDYEQKNEFTPYGGLVVDLTREWSAYGSYTEIFQPQSAYLTAGGAPLKPAVGANYELGVKGELYGGRLNVSAAVFKIKRTGVAVVDNGNLGICTSSLASTDCYRNGGKSQSSGFELEASGEVATGWQIAAGYTNASNRNDSGGSISTETPRHLLRASTSYRLKDDWNAWTIGGSVSAQSGYDYTSGAAYIKEGGRAVWDVNASYRINSHWSAGIRIANLLDRKYYAMNGDTDRGNYYGMPRNVTLTVRGSF